MITKRRYDPNQKQQDRPWDFPRLPFTLRTYKFLVVGCADKPFGYAVGGATLQHAMKRVRQQLGEGVRVIPVADNEWPRFANIAHSGRMAA